MKAIVFSLWAVVGVRCVVVLSKSVILSKLAVEIIPDSSRDKNTGAGLGENVQDCC